MSGEKFMVLKLIKEVDCDVGDKKITMPIGGAFGVVPVFESLEEANKHTEDGRFDVLQVNIGGRK